MFRSMPRKTLSSSHLHLFTSHPLSSSNQFSAHSPQMGCGTSKMEPGDEIPSKLLPLMRRIQELKRTKTDVLWRDRRERKNSIVSTAELLCPEERDIDYYDANIIENCGEKDENGKVNETPELGKSVVENVEEDLPGSPSFRFYFTEAVQTTLDDGGLVSSPKSDSSKRIEEKELLEEEEGPHDSLVPAEGSDFKAIKKEKGRKFMTLPKANFLNVRGCYNMNSCAIDAQEGARILNEKPA